MESTADMSGGPRHGYHHGDLRQALLTAAETELDERGIEGFTLRGCAKRAGVSHAAPAHHFRDAGGLLTALAAEGFRRFTQTMEAEMKLSAPNDTRGRLVGAGLGYLDFARAHPALFRLMFGSQRPDFFDDTLEQTARASFMVLVDAVRALRGADPFTDEAARNDVAATWSILHGLAELLLAGRLKFVAELGENERRDMFRDIISRAARL